MVFTLKKQNHFAHMKERNSTLRDYATQSQHSSSRSRRNSAFHNAPPNPNENTNWIRCLTVCGYIFFVSSPAVFLSYHYTQVWNPKYINKWVYSTHKPKSVNSLYKPTTVRPRRELQLPYARNASFYGGGDSDGSGSEDEFWRESATKFSANEVYGTSRYSSGRAEENATMADSATVELRSTTIRSLDDNYSNPSTDTPPTMINGESVGG